MVVSVTTERKGLTMRKITAMLVMAAMTALAIPAQASDMPACLSVTFDWTDGVPTVTSENGDLFFEDEVTYTLSETSITFTSAAGDTTAPLPVGADQATGCNDGTVFVLEADPQPDEYVEGTEILTGDGVHIYATDLGDGACQQSDGQTGLWDGTTATDEGCITQAEYQAMYPTDDGSDPLDRQVSVDAELEPEAPTVREFFEDPMVRLAELGLTIE